MLSKRTDPTNSENKKNAPSLPYQSKEYVEDCSVYSLDESSLSEEIKQAAQVGFKQTWDLVKKRNPGIQLSQGGITVFYSISRNSHSI